MIKDIEKLRLVAYQCSAGRWTIGWGDTVGVYPGQVITVEDAEARLKARLIEFENAVEHYVEVPLTQNQFDALVSLVYNIGSGAFSTSTLLKRINAGLPASTCAPAFRPFNKVKMRDEKGDVVLDENGKPKLRVEGGLVRRREKEIALFLEPMPN